MSDKTEIPQADKNKIESEGKKWFGVPDPTYKELFRQGAEFGYSLRNEQFEGLKKEIAGWKEYCFNTRNQRNQRIAESIELRKENERLKDLLVKYESWEADIISNDEMWWPNKAKDSLPNEIYEKMLELQMERNILLKRFTKESYKDNKL